jgi:membrane-associated protease RseP (regulator of RpoE activity)
MRAREHRPDPLEEAAPEGTDKTGLFVVLGLLALLAWWGGLPALAIVGGLVVMIFLHELGHYLTAKWAGMKVTEFFIGFGPRIWSFHRGETEYGLKAIPAGAYVRVIGMSNLDDVPPSDEERTYRAKPFWRRMSVALAGSTMHFVQAFLIMVVLLGTIGIQEDASRWRVAAPQGPAAEAGIEAGDRILEVDGQPIREFADLSDALGGLPGEEVDILVLRDGERLSIPVTLASRHPQTGERRGFLGVGPEYDKVRRPAARVVPDAIGEVGRGIQMSVTGLANLFSPSGISRYVDQVSGRVEASDPEGRVTSVVGVVQVATETTQRDWTSLLYILFTVNVFIGVFNLTPLLPFDGGHAVIAIYEKVRSTIAGRRYHADVAKLLPLTYVVVIALGLLMVTSIYLDIARPFEF